MMAELPTDAKAAAKEANRLRECNVSKATILSMLQQAKKCLTPSEDNIRHGFADLASVLICRATTTSKQLQQERVGSDVKTALIEFSRTLPACIENCDSDLTRYRLLRIVRALFHDNPWHGIIRAERNPILAAMCKFFVSVEAATADFAVGSALSLEDAYIRKEEYSTALFVTMVEAFITLLHKKARPRDRPPPLFDELISAAQQDEIDQQAENLFEQTGMLGTVILWVYQNKYPNPSRLFRLLDAWAYNNRDIDAASPFVDLLLHLTTATAQDEICRELANLVATTTYESRKVQARLIESSVQCKLLELCANESYECGLRLTLLKAYYNCIFHHREHINHEQVKLAIESLMEKAQQMLEGKRRATFHLKLGRIVIGLLSNNEQPEDLQYWAVYRECVEKCLTPVAVESMAENGIVSRNNDGLWPASFYNAEAHLLIAAVFRVTAATEEYFSEWAVRFWYGEGESLETTAELYDHLCVSGLDPVFAMTLVKDDASVERMDLHGTLAIIYENLIKYLKQGPKVVRKSEVIAFNLKQRFVTWIENMPTYTQEDIEDWLLETLRCLETINRKVGYVESFEAFDDENLGVAFTFAPTTYVPVHRVTGNDSVSSEFLLGNVGRGKLWFHGCVSSRLKTFISEDSISAGLTEAPHDIGTVDAFYLSECFDHAMAHARTKSKTVSSVEGADPSDCHPVVIVFEVSDEVLLGMPHIIADVKEFSAITFAARSKKKSRDVFKNKEKQDSLQQTVEYLQAATRTDTLPQPSLHTQLANLVRSLNERVNNTSWVFAPMYHSGKQEVATLVFHCDQDEDDDEDDKLNPPHQLRWASTKLKESAKCTPTVSQAQRKTKSKDNRAKPCVAKGQLALMSPDTFVLFDRSMKAVIIKVDDS